MRDDREIGVDLGVGPDRTVEAVVEDGKVVDNREMVPDKVANVLIRRGRDIPPERLSPRMRHRLPPKRSKISGEHLEIQTKTEPGEPGRSVKVDITPNATRPPVATVPCGDCRICCHLPMMLTPKAGDRVMTYDFDPHINWAAKGGPEVSLFLKRVEVAGETGVRRCVYLGPHCSIYDRRPASCRTFDCRQLARQADAGEIPDVQAKIFEAAIEQGRRLIRAARAPSVPSIPSKRRRRR